MNFHFICEVAFAFIILMDKGYAVYNKDVVCVIDIGEQPVCRTLLKANRRANSTPNDPVYDPYIPRTDPKYYICPNLNCSRVILNSMTDVASPKVNLKCCFYEKTYQCEQIRFYHLKKEDKLLFLSDAIPLNIYFMVNCFLYSDGGRICHRNYDYYNHAMLVDLATVARQNQSNIYLEDEFLCEKNVGREILCDLNNYVPYNNSLELKEFINKTTIVLLKTRKELLVMKYECRNLWCGFVGSIRARRFFMKRERYEPPGGHVYRCFAAKGQQVCKRLPFEGKHAARERGWRSQ